MACLKAAGTLPVLSEVLIRAKTLDPTVSKTSLNKRVGILSRGQLDGRNCLTVSDSSERDILCVASSPATRFLPGGWSPVPCTLEEVQYLVHWKVYSPGERSWVPACYILDPELIENFHHLHPNSPRGTAGAFRRPRVVGGGRGFLPRFQVPV